jgi:hypothetical protein
MSKINKDEEAVRIAGVLCGYMPPPEDLVRAVRRGLGSKPTSGFKYAVEASEIITILRAKHARDERRRLVREVGERLCRAGGFAAMQDVAMEIRRQFPSGEGGENGWHPGILEWDWDGICEWRA